MPLTGDSGEVWAVGPAPANLGAAMSMHLIAVRGGQLEKVRRTLELGGFGIEMPSARGLDTPAVPVPAGPLRVGSLVVDRERHEVLIDDSLVHCTPTEFTLLARLAAYPGHVLTRVQLLEHLPGGAPFRTERTVDSHIRNLRRKLAADPGIDTDGKPTIVTVFGIGYKLALSSDRGSRTVGSGISAGMLASSKPRSASVP